MKLKQGQIYRFPPPYLTRYTVALVGRDTFTMRLRSGTEWECWKSAADRHILVTDICDICGEPYPADEMRSAPTRPDGEGGELDICSKCFNGEADHKYSDEYNRGYEDALNGAGPDYGQATTALLMDYIAGYKAGKRDAQDKEREAQ